jgi:hypothetical protein
MTRRKNRFAPRLDKLYFAVAVPTAVLLLCAVIIPAIPAPITNARFATGLSPAIKGAFNFTFAIAVRTRITAFSVASSISLWIQEQCSRMFAISTM